MRREDIVDGEIYAIRSDLPGSGTSVSRAQLTVEPDGTVRRAFPVPGTPEALDPESVICLWSERNARRHAAKSLAGVLTSALRSEGLAAQTGPIRQDGMADVRLSPEALSLIIDTLKQRADQISALRLHQAGQLSASVES